MEKRQRRIFIFFLPGLSVLSFVLSASSARRSRMSERSELVSEEAADLRHHIFSLRACAFCCICFMC
ncbi:hypothetical protein, partial [Enterobacter ludwigii]|uniref:hypothetical protein n=1 Tax=Enterobacter ludwigii TaxID=299767 RepID=UPI001CAA83A0